MAGTRDYIHTEASQSEGHPVDNMVKPVSCTHISWLQLVDDGGFAAVVQSQTQNIDLFLPQAKPARQFIQQPHYSVTSAPLNL